MLHSPPALLHSTVMNGVSKMVFPSLTDPMVFVWLRDLNHAPAGAAGIAEKRRAVMSTMSGLILVMDILGLGGSFEKSPRAASGSCSVEEPYSNVGLPKDCQRTAGGDSACWPVTRVLCWLGSLLCSGFFRKSPIGPGKCFRTGVLFAKLSRWDAP